MTVPSENQPRAQRCDVVLREDGALRIVLSGDWIAPSERWLIEQVFSDIQDHDGPVSLDTAGMLRVSDEVGVLVDGFSARRAAV